MSRTYRAYEPLFSAAELFHTSGAVAIKEFIFNEFVVAKHSSVGLQCSAASGHLSILIGTM